MMKNKEKSHSLYKEVTSVSTSELTENQFITKKRLKSLKRRDSVVLLLF